MTMRSFSMLGVAVTAMAAAIGCAAPSEGDALSSEASGAVDEAAQSSVRPRPALPTYITLDATSATAAQKKAGQLGATKALRYLLGDNSARPAGNWPLMDAFVAKVRSNVNQGWLVWTFYAKANVWGIPAVVYRLTQTQSGYIYPYSRGALREAEWEARDMREEVDQAYGPYAASFFAFNGTTLNAGYLANYIEFDPGPVTLTGDLGSATGATAAAYFTNTPEIPATVVKFGSLPALCGTSVSLVGSPCSPTALVIGQEALRVLTQKNDQCSCR